jgi:uncharacterized RDD family membrane protein YckC
MSDPSLDPRTRSGRFGTRLRGRLGFGLAAGIAGGVALGALAGGLFFGSGTRGFWITTFSVTLFVTLVTLLMVGYGSLESPDPGAEPTQDDRPVADREGLTRVEHPTDTAGGPR